MPETHVAGLHLEEVDGVRVLWRDVPGPFHAHLVLRGGQADEQLPVRGISHLVEHLVLSGSSLAPHAYNGSTGTLFTSYVMVGEPEQAVEHIAQVCTNLSDLPTERLDHEKQVLRAEAAQRGRSPADPLASWRWGPVGFGLTAFDEFGVRSTDCEQARLWARRFAADRAVLWLSGPPPQGLRLPLPQVGPPLGPLEIATSWAPTPGCFPIGARGVSFSLLGPRTPAAPNAMWLLGHRLEQRLRHELGLVYGVSTGTDLIAADTRCLMFRLDCLDENSVRVQEETCRVLEELGRLATDVEWATLASHRQLGTQSPLDLRSLQMLDTGAQDLLLGREPVDPDAWQRLVESATREDVRNYLTQVMPTLVIGVADPERVPAAVATSIPIFSSHRVDGHVLKPSPQHSDRRVRSAIVGRQGATIVFDGGDSITVEAANLAGALCSPDGMRHLIGKDGFHVRINPEEWLAPAPALADLDVALPVALRIPEEGRKSEQTHPTKATGWTSREYVYAAWAAVMLLGGLVALSVGNSDAGTFWPVVGALLFARLGWQRQRRRSDGGS